MKITITHFARELSRRAALLLAALSTLTLTTACDNTEAQDSEPRWVMIFLDMSLSTLPDRENYQKYIQNIVARLNAGDRVTVCKIIDLTIADFAPIYDATLPSFNFWTDNRTQYHKHTRGITDQILSTVDSVLQTKPRIQKAEIINSFIICDQLMRGKRGKKSLVIISDMQESSSEFDFRTDTMTPAYVSQALATLKSKGRIPNLSGVEVWIAGAYSKETERYFMIQDFWSRYIAASGAELKSYSHTLLDFE